jgi:RNase P/RNase MRP subunit p29
MHEEYIGQSLEIIKSDNDSLKNKKGKIIDETKNLFIIEEGSSKKIIKILKKGNIFLINKKKIDGNKIIKRPEDRIKLIKKYN